MSSIHAEPPPPIVTEPSGINYATGSALGKGGFAICHKAERYDGSKPTGQMVALKIVRTKMEPAKLAQKVRIPIGMLVFGSLIIGAVCYRVANPLETLTPKHRRFLSSLLLPDEHVCRARALR
jgi:hypothetical protein